MSTMEILLIIILFVLIIYAFSTSGKLKNVQVMDHHIGFPLNHVPVLVMDTWEHAFFLDYKANRGAYIDVFFKNINWSVVNSRVSQLVK